MKEGFLYVSQCVRLSLFRLVWRPLASFRIVGATLSARLPPLCRRLFALSSRENSARRIWLGGTERLRRPDCCSSQLWKAPGVKEG